MFCLVALVALAQSVKLVKRDFGPKITISVPEEFYLWETANVIQRLGTAKEPLALYSDQSTHVSISVSKAVDSLSGNTQIRYATGAHESYTRDINVEKSFLKASLSSLHKEITFLQDDIVTINGKQFIVFEFDGIIEGYGKGANKIQSSIYGYIMYHLSGQTTYIINFGCPAKVKAKWAPVAKDMMASVKVKK